MDSVRFVQFFVHREQRAEFSVAVLQQVMNPAELVVDHLGEIPIVGVQIAFWGAHGALYAQAAQRHQIL